MIIKRHSRNLKSRFPRLTNPAEFTAYTLTYFEVTVCDFPWLLEFLILKKEDTYDMLI